MIEFLKSGILNSGISDVSFAFYLGLYLMICNKINKKKNIPYFEFKSKTIIVELILFELILCLFGIQGILDGVVVLYVYFTNAYYDKYVKKDSIDPDEIAKSCIPYNIKAAVGLLVLCILLTFTNVVLVGVFMFSFVSYALIAMLRVMSLVKEVENYKVMSDAEVLSNFTQEQINQIYDESFQNLTRIQSSISSYTLDDVHYLMSDEMYFKYKNIQQQDIAKSQKSIIENPTFIKANLSCFTTNENVNQEFEIVFEYTCIKYTINIETGTIISGTSNHTKKITGMYTFEYKENTYVLVDEKIYKEE